MLLFANINQATPNNSAGTLPLQARRPIQGWADITYSFNGGKSRYHAFQGKLDWRIGAGFSILNSLTLSQTKDNGAGSLEGASGNFPAPQNFYDLDADYGLGAYHQPYNNTTSFVLDLPFGAGRRYAGDASPVVDALIGGWQIAGISSVYAGENVTLHTRLAPPSWCPVSNRTSAARTTIGRMSSAKYWCRRTSATRRTGSAGAAWRPRRIRASHSATRREMRTAGRRSGK